METLLNYHFWISLFTLSTLEVVLGIDNIIVIGILVNKLPVQQRKKAQLIGLGLAMFARIALLVTLAWISHLIKPLFVISSFTITGRDIVLFLGGLFLLYKAISELYETVMCKEHNEQDDQQSGTKKFGGVLLQIILLDIVFSLDSVITAIGIADHISVMITAIIIAVFCMMLFVGPISRFIEKHIIIKLLALTFLVLVGIILTADGLHFHIEKSYAYVAMFFSFILCVLYIIYSNNLQKIKNSNQDSK